MSALDALLASAASGRDAADGAALERGCTPLSFSPRSGSSGDSRFHLMQSPLAAAAVRERGGGRGGTLQHERPALEGGGERA